MNQFTSSPVKGLVEDISKSSKIDKTPTVLDADCGTTDSFSFKVVVGTQSQGTPTLKPTIKPPYRLREKSPAAKNLLSSFEAADTVQKAPAAGFWAGVKSLFTSLKIGRSLQTESSHPQPPAAGLQTICSREVCPRASPCSNYSGSMPVNFTVEVHPDFLPRRSRTLSVRRHSSNPGSVRTNLLGAFNASPPPQAVSRSSDPQPASGSFGSHFEPCGFQCLCPALLCGTSFGPCKFKYETQMSSSSVNNIRPAEWRNEAIGNVETDRPSKNRWWC